MFVTPADEALLLDLLNTTPVVDGISQDSLAGDSAARAWSRARGGSGSSAEAARLRTARPILQSLVRGERSPAVLAPLLAGVYYRPVAGTSGVTWTLEVADSRRQATRAVLAWAELHDAVPGRLRPCANPECALFLLDRSKANSARWCSMAVCGNRMKARRHYERTRQADA